MPHSQNAALRLPPIDLIENQEQLTHARVEALPKTFEIINVSLGLLLMILSPLSFYLLEPHEYKSFYTPAMSVLFNIILLNITHNAFSFILPLVSPEVRSWWKSSKHFGIGTSLFIGLCFGGCFLLYLIPNYFLLNSPKRAQAMIFIATFVLLFAKKHAFGQTYGISRLYDHRKMKLYGPLSLRDQSLIRWQKILMRVLLGMIMLRVTVPLVVTQAGVWMLGLTIGICLVIPMIMGLAFLEEKSKCSNKGFYLSRLWTFGLIEFGNPVPYFGTFLLHSLESAFVTGVMLKNSYSKKQKLKVVTRRYWGVALAVLGLTVLCVLAQDYLFGKDLKIKFPGQLIVVTTLASLSTALTFSHYILDEIMFKMKDSKVKEQIAPLLSPDGFKN